MKTILVAVDFSNITDKLLQAAVTISSGGHSKVYIVHISAPEPDFVGMSVGPQSVRDARAQTLREEHEHLAEYKKQLQRQGVDAEALLVQGPTVETLLDEVVKLEADILIMGRKGHGMLHKVLIGSVCQDILQKLKIPALIIPEVE